MRIPTTVHQALAFLPVKVKFGPKHWKTELLRMWRDGRYDADVVVDPIQRRELNAFRDLWGFEWLRQHWRTNKERARDLLTDRFSPLGRV